MENNLDTTQLQKSLNYEFNNIALLENALCHSSYVNEHPNDNLKDNECLEFLGDAVLNLIVGHLLMDKYPHLNEGDLSRMRANLVNEQQLAKIAGSINLGVFVQLGRGEIQTKGREKNSILSDTLEAVIAAIYLDGGFEKAFEIIKKQFTVYINDNLVPSLIQDSKSLLQEFSQIKYKVMPGYKVINENGPDHDKTFEVKVTIPNIASIGIGKSKKSAEQDAARIALESLKKDNLIK